MLPHRKVDIDVNLALGPRADPNSVAQEALGELGFHRVIYRVNCLAVKLDEALKTAVHPGSLKVEIVTHVPRAVLSWLALWLPQAA